MTALRARPALALAGLTIVLLLLAGLRGLDHDESQYVAAARLTAAGLIPYRDYAYLQTPLQPFVFAPLAWMFGGWTLPAMRAANALLGAVAVGGAWRGMRAAGAEARTALGCAGLFAACDILLFSVGTARNDALPAALFALALAPMIRADRGEGSRASAVVVGLLLAAAAAAKISYGLPAAAYGACALARPARHRPLAVAVGALPAVALTAGLWALAPEGAWFGMVTFPAEAPAEYYAATDRLSKLSAAAKALDVLKFLALGAALLAVVVSVRRARAPGLVEWLFVAGLIAALLPSPTWRQYLLPALPPLFVLLARTWSQHPPTRGWRRAAGVFALVGLVPSVAAIVGNAGLGSALGEINRLAAVPVGGRVATLSPQFLPRALVPDARFAAGPFYFRSTGLLGAEAEARLHLVSRARLAVLDRDSPDFVLVGGEDRWTSGDPRLDAELERWVVARRWRRVATDGRLRLYVAPDPATAVILRAIASK